MVRTTRGRVVYNRKHHSFTWRDVNRIAKSLETPYEPLQEYYLLWSAHRAIGHLMERADSRAYAALREADAQLARMSESVIESNPFVDFGGGSFGGAGASRDIHWPWEGNPFKTE